MTSIYPSSTSSNSSTSSANLLRISGMASGIDTDSVVKSMVSSYQTKIDKANQAKQTLQWKQEIYRDIIKDVKGLQDYFDPISSKYILSSNSLNTNTASSDETSIVSATVDSTVKAGNYNVKVSQLATQAKIEGNFKDSMISATLGNWTGKTLEFDVNNGTKVDLTNLAGGNIIELVANINSKIATSSLNGKITASYVKESNGTEYIKFIQNSSNTDTIKLLDADNAITDITDTTINNGISSTSKLTSALGFSSGKDIEFNLAIGASTKNVKLTVSNSSTVQDLIDAVKSATSGEVTMGIDDNTGKISFESKSYGSSSNITITNVNVDNNIITKLGIAVTTDTGADAIVAIKAPGQSAATTTTQSSNQFTLNGVTYNLVGVNDVTNPDSNIAVTSNSDTVVTNIKKFIDDYNSVITKINTKLTEKKDADYSPLTDAQKESMSEDQITAWETKAKVGILRNDDYLSSLLTQLRGAFSSPVYSSYTDSSTNSRISLNFGNYTSGAIGLDTSSTNHTDGGLIYIKDKAKLKSAIENNIDDLKKLFIGQSSDTLSTNQSYVGSTKYMEDGIFTRIDGILRDYVAAPGIGEDGTYTLSGTMNIFVNKQYDNTISGSASKNTLPDQVHGKALIISKLKTQMSDAETRYYKKFTALETAMNKLNSQQSQLSSMLGTS